MKIFDLFNNTTREPSDIVEAEVDSSPVTTKPAMPTNPIDTVTMDVPLLLRIMEYSKEDAATDMDLHHVVEKLVDLSQDGQKLSMSHYSQVVGTQNEAIGGSSAEDLIRDIEYRKPKSKLKQTTEGYGRYWCSTDKRWKERQGPKQSRS